MRPIPSNPVPFNPSFLKVSRSDMVGLYVDCAAALTLWDGEPDAVGYDLRLREVERHIVAEYGLH